jgi:hypothetical protein
MRDFLEVVAILVAIVAVCEVLSMLTSLVRWVNAKANIAEEQYQQLKQLNTNYWKEPGRIRNKRDW